MTTPETAPHCFRAPSAIDLAIDRATGNPGLRWVRRSVMLECRHCERRQPAPMDETDAPGTARVVCVCDRCPQEDNGLIDYFDAQGRQLDLEGRPMGHARR